MARAPKPFPTPAPRDGLADWPRVLAARNRPMAERLEVALSWNRAVSELRASLAARPPSA